jgi:hypothetical protein
MELKPKGLKGEEGFVLVLAMLFMLVLTLIGVSAVNTTTYDNAISGNLRISKEAFYIAEAGLHEFMGRFRPEATGEITDTNPSSPDWRLFLARNTGRAAGVGYDSTDPNHVFTQSLQNEMDYGVEIKHKVDASNNVVTRAGFPVYMVKSHGFTVQRGNKVVEGEIIRRPNFEPPASLYSKAPVLIRGSTTHIDGMDHCGSVNMPGIITTTPTVNQEGNPVINGVPSVITDSTQNIFLREIAEYFGDVADFSYNFQADQTLSGYSDQWGSPVDSGDRTSPLTYEGPMNIVYFNMQGDKTLSLEGHSHGGGLLVVNGNLRITGGFNWYGVIIVTGSLLFEGGAEKNVSGGILAGETSTLMTDIAGDAHIFYCYEAVRKLKGRIPLRMTLWREVN